MANPTPSTPPPTEPSGSKRTGVFGRWANRELQERPPWWGRLETRITISLVAIGILCVGASTWLVRVTVRYYDELGNQAVEAEREVIGIAKQAYPLIAAAQREAFDSKTELLAQELGSLSPELAEARAREWTDQSPASHGVLELGLELPGRDPLALDGSLADESGWIRVPVTRLVGESGVLRVTWAADASIGERHQRIGELEHDLGQVELPEVGGGQIVERNEVQRAVIAALGVASGLVLFSAILAGILIARRTTRKVSDMSRVMREVASGDTSLRAPRLGRDELGQLAAAFNIMLDELESSRQRITYLQRIGAWQDMARRIAHEIKNPLTPIQLAVQQLREKDPGGDERFSALLRESVEIVEDEVEGLRRMVTSFSQFARVPEVQPEPVELDRIVVEFERAYGRVGSAGVSGTGDAPGDERLELVAPSDPGLIVLADRQLLKQVLVNLVENAISSITEAGIEPAHVRISSGRVPGRPFAFLVVEDNGPGIEPERRDRVFEPYETTRERGTGLGLAIVKKIVLDHGGEVVIGDSELRGARFELHIPLSRGPGMPTAARPGSVVASPKPSR